MNRLKKTLFTAISSLAVLFTITAFIISDPSADLRIETIGLDDRIALSEISTKNQRVGNFKTAFAFKRESLGDTEQEFYGQEILISDNPMVDRILIGVTNNLISSVEVWNQNVLVTSKKVGFVGKVTWGATQTMAIDFQDETNLKSKGKSKISMRFYSGTGFFADIATISLDLTDFGNFEGDKSVGVFARSSGRQVSQKPEFSDFRVWKNYKNFD